VNPREPNCPTGNVELVLKFFPESGAGCGSGPFGFLWSRESVTVPGEEEGADPESGRFCPALREQPEVKRSWKTWKSLGILKMFISRPGKKSNPKVLEKF